MKFAFALAFLSLALGAGAVSAEEAPVAGNPPPAAPAPGVVLQGGALPAGAATNLVFLAPVVAGALGVAALAGAGGGGTNSTTSTTSN